MGGRWRARARWGVGPGENAGACGALYRTRSRGGAGTGKAVRVGVCGGLAENVSGVDGWAGSDGSAGPVDVDGRAGFEAVFLDPVGQEVRQRWEDVCVAVAFEDLAPVSAFPVPPGRRWGPGLWWSATTGRHVVAGSNAMRAQLMVLDRDPQVTGLAGRPVRLVWRDRGGSARSWVPQLFARYADGTALLADCPGHAEAGGERALRAAQAVRAACDLVGWRYRRLEPLDAVFAANLRWLAGYRHPRYQGRDGIAAHLPALGGELVREAAQRLRRPRQRPHRITLCAVLDQLQQGRHQSRVFLCQGRAPGPRPPDPPVRIPSRIEFGQATVDAARRDPRGPRHRGDPAVSKLPGLRAVQDPALPLVQVRGHRLELRP